MRIGVSRSGDAEGIIDRGPLRRRPLPSKEAGGRGCRSWMAARFEATGASGDSHRSSTMLLHDCVEGIRSNMFYPRYMIKSPFRTKVALRAPLTCWRRAATCVTRARISFRDRFGNDVGLFCLRPVTSAVLASGIPCRILARPRRGRRVFCAAALDRIWAFAAPGRRPNESQWRRWPSSHGCESRLRCRDRSKYFAPRGSRL